MKHFLLSLGLLLCCVTASLAQDRNAEVPLNDSAYADLALIAPSLFQPGDDCYYSRPRSHAMTRYEFAVGTVRSLRNMQLLPKHTTLSQKELLAAKRLVEKFSPELKDLGIIVEQIRINGVYLIEPQNAQPKLPVAPPFVDVPRNHWAY